MINKNKNGFTLVELVVTISILLLLVSITVPSIIGLLNKNKSKYDKAVIEELEKMARLYVEENNLENSIEEDNTYCVLLSDLGDELPQTSNEEYITGRVDINKDNNKVNYIFNSEKSNDEGCTKLESTTSYSEDSINLDIASNDKNLTYAEGDSTLRKIILGDYDITTGAYKNVDYFEPDFSIIAPLNDVNGIKTEYINQYTNYCRSLTYCDPFWTFKKMCYLYNDGTKSCDDDNTVDQDNIDGRYYFSNDYSWGYWDEKFTLDNPQLKTISEAVESGYVYTCLGRKNNTTHTCEKLYKVESYSTSTSYIPNSYITDDSYGDSYGELETITSAKVYTLKPRSGAGSGLFRSYDNDGETYYYRGDVNNHIKFGEDGPIYQVMRINGNGNIRVIATDMLGPVDYCENTGTDANGTCHNGTYGNGDTIVLTKDKITETLSSYTDLNNYDEYLQTDKFCIDESTENICIGKDCGKVNKLRLRLSTYVNFNTTTRNANISPTYKCQNEHTISKKIGTITADDLVYAGFITHAMVTMYPETYDTYSKFYNSHFFENTNQYILNGKIINESYTIATLDPDIFLSRDGFVGTSNIGDTYAIDATKYDSYVHVDPINPDYAYILPVVNIVGDIEVKLNDDGSIRGDGTKNNPYILDVDGDCFEKIENGITTKVCGDENRPSQ